MERSRRCIGQTCRRQRPSKFHSLIAVTANETYGVGQHKPEVGLTFINNLSGNSSGLITNAKNVLEFSSTVPSVDKNTPQKVHIHYIVSHIKSVLKNS